MKIRQVNQFKLRKGLKMWVGMLLGGLGGYAWYRFIGCSTGACPLTSNPYISTFYGVLLGFLFSR